MTLTSKYKFDVKVGIIGPVSAGKTTALNALLGNKFSEVSMGRTTKAVNLFRISPLARESKRAKLSPSDLTDEGKVEEVAVPSKNSSSVADEILQEITSDNSRLQGCTRVEEKFFDVDLDEALLKDMREDIRLVIADIPGVNEAGAKNVYLDYVRGTWPSYDAIIVVMDAKQGVNTDEQIAILNFVQENLVKQKRLPVIIICNKVDNPDDDELLGLVLEAQRKVEDIFGVDDRAKALEAILGTSGSHTSIQDSPAFLPTSMQNAFVYKYVSGLHPNDLCRLDKGHLDKIGTQEVGMYAWKKLSEQEKYSHVHQIINDPAQFKERLAASNFDRLLDILQYFIGGKSAQEEIIKKQLELALSIVSKCSLSQNSIANELRVIIQKSTALEDHASFAAKVDETFWALYRQKFELACQDFTNDLDVIGMQHCMNELYAYANGLLGKVVGSEAKREREEKVFGKMKAVVEIYIKIIISQEAQWTPRKPASKVMGGQGWPRDWDDFSPKDWSTVIDSILMLEHRPVFYSNFGQQIVDLKYIARTGTFVQPDDYCFKCRSVCSNEDHEEKKYLKDYKRFMKGNYDDHGNLTPRKQGRYDRAVQIKVLASPSDPSHWGYLVWFFCEYAKSLEA